MWARSLVQLGLWALVPQAPLEPLEPLEPRATQVPLVQPARCRVPQVSQVPQDLPATQGTLDQLVLQHQLVPAVSLDQQVQQATLVPAVQTAQSQDQLVTLVPQVTLVPLDWQPLAPQVLPSLALLVRLVPQAAQVPKALPALSLVPRDTQVSLVPQARHSLVRLALP